MSGGSRPRSRRPSGLGSNSRKFFEVKGPDGKVFTVVKARSAATMLCLAENGGWPARGFTKFDYDAEFIPGEFIEGVNEIPGHRDLGQVTTYRVIEVHKRFSLLPGTYSQLRRWVLIEPVMSDDDAGDLNLDDLRGHN